MLDIRGNDPDTRVARLSNFTARHFVIDATPCSSLEGFLQSLKIRDKEKQKSLCAMVGIQAKKTGQHYNDWKEKQLLWWGGIPYLRQSADYIKLITKAYDEAFCQDLTFRHDLLAIGYEEIRHSIGNPNMNDTVLTEVEMLYQLYRLRMRVLEKV